jgi:hypothetical protein
MALPYTPEHGEEIIWEASVDPAPGDPAAVVEDFVRSVQAGDLSAVASLLSRTVVGAVDPEVIRRNFTASREEIAARGGVRRIEVISRSIRAAWAELSLAMVYGDGSSDSETVALVREYGAWRVDLTR